MQKVYHYDKAEAVIKADMDGNFTWTQSYVLATYNTKNRGEYFGYLDYNILRKRIMFFDDNMKLFAELRHCYTENVRHKVIQPLDR